MELQTPHDWGQDLGNAVKKRNLKETKAQSTEPETGDGAKSRFVPPPRTWAHVVARWMILPLVNTPVTPNHITTIRLITGVAAAVLFAQGNVASTFWGGFLFAFSALVDRADGELARVSGRTSPGGHAYDFKCDAVSSSLAFLGIGIGLRFESIGWWSGVLGLIGSVSVAAIYWLVTRIEAAKKDRKPVFSGAGRFDPDDALFLLGPIAWMGPKALWPLIVSAAIGAPLFLVWAVLRDRKALFSKER